MPDHAAPRDDLSPATSRVALPRAAAALTAGACTVQFSAVPPVLVMPLLLLGLALATALSVILGMRASIRQELAITCVAVMGGFGLFSNAYLAIKFGVPVWAGLALMSVMVVAAGVASFSRPGRRGRGLVVLLAAFSILVASRLSAPGLRIDVQGFLLGGIDALLHGASPYAITIDDPYDAVDGSLFYGSGITIDGVVHVGYPYLPVPMLLDVPAYLLGDPRWMHLAGVILATVVAWRLATDPLGRAASVLLLCASTSSTLVIGYWVEPLMIGLLVLTVAGLRAGHPWTAVPLGLFFASKQYAVVYLPALLTVARLSGWRTVLAAGGLGVATVLPFVVWDLDAFVRSAVEFQLLQPLREDAVSLLPALWNTFGALPSWTLSVAPVLGFLVSALVARRTRPGPTAFTLGIGLSLLITVITSKNGFLNYYALISAALAFATVTWTTDDPVLESSDAGDAQTREPSSQGSRGERGISRTR